MAGPKKAVTRTETIDQAAVMPQARRTIVLVEDDKLVAKYMSRTLSPYTEILVCPTEGTAREAIDVAQTKGYRYAAFVIDVCLPNGGNGLTIAQAVHERWPETRTLVCSGLRTKWITDCVALLGKQFMEKPVTMPVLEAFAVGALVKERFAVEDIYLDKVMSPLVGVPPPDARSLEMLIFDPDPETRHALAASASTYARVLESEEPEHALSVIRSRQLCGAIIGIGSEDRKSDMNHDAGPWAALDVFMMKNPTRPAMIVTRRYDRLLAERAGERGAVCYELPVGEGVLARFAETAARVDTPGEAKVRAFVAAAIRAKGLGGSASRVLLAGLLGISTADLPGGAHLSADGIRSQEQSLRAAFNYEGKFQPLLVHLFREIFL